MKKIISSILIMLSIGQAQDDNYSLNFDGSGDYVDLPDDISFSSSPGVTISMWVKSSWSDSRFTLITFNNGTGSPNTHTQRYNLGCNKSNSDIKFFTEGGDLVPSHTFVNYQPNYNDLANEWVLITATADFDDYKMYLNGSLVATESNVSPIDFILSNSGDARIGADVYSGDDYTGLMDEVSIWNRALTSEEVSGLYNYELSGNESGLISYWQFNDGIGTSLTDGSGNNYHATINNATWNGDGAPIVVPYFASLNVGEEEGLIFQNIIGDTVLVPVNIDLMGNQIYSAELRFNGFQSQLEFIDVDTNNTLSGEAGWDIVINEQTDLLITVGYGSTAVTGDGSLFNLKLFIPDSLNEDTIPIYITEVGLDENTDSVAVDSGSVSVKHLLYGDVTMNDDVSALDAAMVLRYLVGSETFDVYQTLSADVTLDETISALDASVIAQYVAELITELPHSDVSALTGVGDFAIEDGEFNIGEIIEIPIQLIGGDNLLSFEIDIEYDPEIVSFEMVDWSDLIEHFSIEENNESGLLRVAGSGSTPDGVEGVFGNLQVFVDGGFEGESFDITINEYRVNENDFVENIVATFNKTSVGIGDLNTTPDIYSLHQNYPNPFNPTTQIKYDLPEDAMVSITIYDIMGRSIKSLVNTTQSAGYRSIQWDATNNLGEPVSAGMYIYMIQAGQFTQTKKMVLLK